MTDRYISPTGNDTTGSGTIGSPWLTLAKFATVAVAGDTLYCRGGTYTGTVTATISGVSGTSGSPITVASYPGETPVFRGVGADAGAKAFAQFQGGSSYWIVDGLQFENFKATGTGVIWIGDAAVSTHHFTIRNCRFAQMPGGTTSDQQVYLSYRADDCTVEDNIFAGAGVDDEGGTAVNVGDHSPAPLRYIIQRNVMWGFGSSGCIWMNGGTGSILHNTFLDPCNAFIRLASYTTVTVQDNAGTHGTNYMGDIYDQGTGTKTIDHNYWGQTFNTDYSPVTGATCIGGATDGTDAGARPHRQSRGVAVT